MDTRKLPKTISDVQSYGIEEINKLVNFYGADRKDTYKRECVFQKAYLDKITIVAEFEQTMLEKCKSYREMIDIKNNQINRSRRNSTISKTKTTVYTFNVIVMQILYFKN